MSRSFAVTTTAATVSAMWVADRLRPDHTTVFTAGAPLQTSSAASIHHATQGLKGLPNDASQETRTATLSTKGLLAFGAGYGALMTASRGLRSRKQVARRAESADIEVAEKTETKPVSYLETIPRTIIEKRTLDKLLSTVPKEQWENPPEDSYLYTLKAYARNSAIEPEECADEENPSSLLTDPSKTCADKAALAKANCAGGMSQEPLDFKQVANELHRIWYIAILAGIFHVFTSLEVHFFLPYLYSRVHCCDSGLELDSQYDITHPSQVSELLAEARMMGVEVEVTAGTKEDQRIHACDVPAFPSTSQHWSLSSHCVNRAFVHDSAQGTMARIKPLQKLVALTLLPVGGSLADSIGRRPVLTFYATMLLAASLLAMFDCKVVSSWGDTPVVLASMLLSSSFQPKDTIISSSIADIVGHQEAGKSRAFSGLMAMNTGLNLACLMATYHFIRMHISNYATPWMGFVGLAVGMLVLLATMQETLPSELRRPLSARMLDPLQAQLRGLRLLRQDPVLIQLGFTTFLWGGFTVAFMSTRCSYLIMMGFTIEESMFPEMTACIFGILFSGGLVTLIPRIGVLPAVTVGFGLWTTSFALWGPAMVLLGRFCAYPAAIFQAAALVCLGASLPTAVSQRVGTAHQATCQAALMALAGLGAMICVPIFNHVLFSATAQGMARAQPSIAGMMMASVSFLVTLRVSVLEGHSPKVEPVGGL